MRLNADEIEAIRSDKGIPTNLTEAISKYEKFPAVLQIELTNHCNKACWFCAMRDRYNQDEIPLGYMEWDLYKSIIDQCPVRRSILLSNCGESLLHPEFGRMAKYAKSKDLLTTVVTNGLLLDEKKEELMDLDEIMVSVVDTSALDSLKKFMDYKKTATRPIVKMKLYNNMPVAFKEEIPTVDKIIMLEKIRFPDSLDTGKMRESKELCYHVVMMPAITWDGDFLICCMDYRREATIGNVAKEPIGNLWRVENYIRDLQMKGFFTPPCNRCRRADDG